ncbi:hypothetical protein C0389_06860 [bacterium]|nr:hypothetical protein [bacterium]
MKRPGFNKLNKGESLGASGCCAMLALSLLFIGGCKIPASNVDLKDAGMDIVKGNTVANNQGYILKVDSITNTVTLQVLPKYNKPMVEVNTRKIVFSEPSNEFKEITEQENTYNDDGKLIKEYIRHEIPAKKDTKQSGMPVFGVLMASLPSWLILAGIILFGLYRLIKWLRNEKRDWVKK